MNRVKRMMSILLCVVIPVSLSMVCTPAQAAANPSGQENEVESVLETMFKERAKALVTQDMPAIEAFYDKEKASRVAYWHERNRCNYMNKWAEKRDVKLTHADSSIRIVRKSVHQEYAKISLVQSEQIGYTYMKKFLPEQYFGVGTRHFITLKKTDGVWTIYREWYLDPLDENPDKIADGTLPSINKEADESEHNGSSYKRKRAVHYANKYAGAAWGAGNHHHYNKKYLDYTGKGGDCTNFASQVVGDEKEGGGLSHKGGWRYFKGTGGTRTWVHTDSFSHFLTYSGYGRVIKQGRYEEVVAPSSKHPNGAVSELKPGDLIAYIPRNNDIDHFAVIVGFNDYGYPLVNCHTADRYHVPFDLGWDRNTKYRLIHIKD
ncbi:amidase domain-containing protein [Paenibacillus sp. HN-1]|uniref:amidase domain-containing protein n=1 Tax=Paenibacillus TaxID=44249 RepID=UPI001CA8D9EE|nr:MULTISPECIES: amidase domain-containing protein [Paenibacillus]MBY9078086.1 amidase domain-containing protein [Paenibacillus sp. CGMCC 1.18879]MBY9083827.1 amidase domain-containing protein [Paenibacillus sinensis]